MEFLVQIIFLSLLSTSTSHCLKALLYSLFSDPFCVLGTARGRCRKLQSVTWQGVEEVSSGHFVSATVVGGKSIAMDSKGNKVIVCDNGTGVSRSVYYILETAFYKLIFLFVVASSLSSADMQARTFQLTSFLRWWEDRLLDRRRKLVILKWRFVLCLAYYSLSFNSLKPYFHYIFKNYVNQLFRSAGFDGRRWSKQTSAHVGSELSHG